MERIESVSPERAGVWAWMDENWRQYVCRPADLPRRSMAEAPPRGTGVYFIWDVDGNLLYVGQSIYLRERIAQHRRTPGADSWSCINTPSGYWFGAEQVEGCYIRALCPPRNKQTTLKMWPGHGDMVAAITAALRHTERTP